MSKETAKGIVEEIIYLQKELEPMILEKMKCLAKVTNNDFYNQVVSFDSGLIDVFEDTIEIELSYRNGDSEWLVFDSSDLDLSNKEFIEKEEKKIKDKKRAEEESKIAQEKAREEANYQYYLRLKDKYESEGTPLRED